MKLGNLSLSSLSVTKKQKKVAGAVVGSLIIGISCLRLLHWRKEHVSAAVVDAERFVFTMQAEEEVAQDNPNGLYCSADGSSYDAVVVLGGGTPLDVRSPPLWVQQRADLAAAAYFSLCAESSRPPFLLTLSGGSAHSPQLIDQETGLPVFESAATAAYLMEKRHIPPSQVLFETSSYDTIGNAFFARTSFIDVQQWVS